MTFLLIHPASLHAQEAPSDDSARDASDETLSFAPVVDVLDEAQLLRERIIQLTNAERLNLELPALDENSALTAAAQAHANWMAISGCFDHICPEEPPVDARLLSAGYQWSRLGENIAFGYPTPEQVVSGWMNSPGHRANILNPNLHDIGVGVIQNTSRPYWVQDFGTAR